MADTRKLKVFLCHASQDKPAVRKLYANLIAVPWIDPWLDEEYLLPGMDWDQEIQKALRDADQIIVCLSKESVAKEGYVQREFKRALSYAEEKPEEQFISFPCAWMSALLQSDFSNGSGWTILQRIPGNGYYKRCRCERRNWELIQLLSPRQSHLKPQQSLH